MHYLWQCILLYTFLSYFSTAIGGMLLLASGEQSGSFIPDSPGHWMGALATLLSFINISGGFLVSGKMLDLFRRPEDPKEFFELYGIPTAVVLSGLAAAGLFGIGDLSLMSGSASIAASLLCISAIAGKHFRVRATVLNYLFSRLRLLASSSCQSKNRKDRKRDGHGRSDHGSCRHNI
jgi:4TM region of pyridine nucleotide transhydrogenase, mitoch